MTYKSYRALRPQRGRQAPRHVPAFCISIARPQFHVERGLAAHAASLAAQLAFERHQARVARPPLQQHHIRNDCLVRARVAAGAHQVEGAQVLKPESVARRSCRLVIRHALAYRTEDEHVNGGKHRPVAVPRSQRVLCVVRTAGKPGPARPANQQARPCRRATPSASRICASSTWCAPAVTPAGTRRSLRTQRCCRGGPPTRASCRLSGSCAAGSAAQGARARST